MPVALSAHALAAALCVAAPRINDIVSEKRRITPDTALRLAQHFNGSPQFWLNLQTSYELNIAQLASWYYRTPHVFVQHACANANCKKFSAQRSLRQIRAILRSI